MEHGVSGRQPARDVPAATAPAEHPGSPRSGFASATLLMAGVVLGWLAILVLVLRLAALPPAASGKLLVLFTPGSSEPEAFTAILAAGGAPVRPVLGGLAWIAAANAPGFVARLQANGALAAYPGAPVGLTLAGCFAFATDQPHPRARTLGPRLAGGP